MAPRIVLFFVVIFTSSCSTLAHRTPANLSPAPLGDSGEGGTRAEGASPSPRLVDERAPVYIDGKYGYIDRAGVLVIPAIYDDAQPFAEDVAAVKTGGRWLYIDTRGNNKIAVPYQRVFPFSEGRARGTCKQQL